MKTFSRKSAVTLAILAVQMVLLTATGCKLARSPGDERAEVDGAGGFMPAGVQILPLSEFVEDQNGVVLRSYVAVFDSFDTQIKSPGVFRFELYERISHSSQPKGRRLRIWDDIDLTGPEDNNEHWSDFIRAYEFGLDFEPEAGAEYILEVTCITGRQRRLTDQFVVSYEP